MKKSVPNLCSSAASTHYSIVSARRTLRESYLILVCLKQYSQFYADVESLRWAAIWYKTVRFRSIATEIPGPNTLVDYSSTWHCVYGRTSQDLSSTSSLCSSKFCGWSNGGPRPCRHSSTSKCLLYSCVHVQSL